MAPTLLNRLALFITLLLIAKPSTSAPQSAPRSHSQQIPYHFHAREDGRNHAITDPLYHDRIIPDVIPQNSSYTFEPLVFPRVAYNQPRNATDGPPPGNYYAEFQLVSINVTAKAPRISEIFTMFDEPPSQYGSDCTYTLAMTDPDATSRDDPQRAEICHWIVTGLKARDSDSDDLSGTADVKTVIEYAPPAPPKGTGVHRYTFLVFRRDDCKPSDLKKPESRVRWGQDQTGQNAVRWGAENNLTLVGATFMQVMNGY